MLPRQFTKLATCIRVKDPLVCNSFVDALRIYQWNHYCLVDVATTMANHGWVQLLLSQQDAALKFTKDALTLLQDFLDQPIIGIFQVPQECTRLACN
jgi:hypothetical protein